MGDNKHDKLFIFLAIILVLEFAFAKAIKALAGDTGIELGIFKSTTGAISRLYFIEITPIYWTISIWKLIYVWEVLWIVYVLTAICRKNNFGPVYLNPPLITPFFMALFTLNSAFNITWTFLWDRQLVPWCLVVDFLYACNMYTMLVSNHRQVYNYMAALKKYHKWDLFWNRALTQNGVALYATWVSIATFLNLATVLTYWVGINQSTASTISLSFLTCEILCYFLLENFIWEKYLRYTYSVWPVVIWALIGSIVQNWDSEKTNSIITAVLLVLTCILYIIKIGLSIWRGRTQPIGGPVKA